MWFKIKTYLLFLLRSFHLHGIHSPFVFQLQQTCFKGKKEKMLLRLVEYLKIETILLFGKSAENEIFKTSKTVITDPADVQQINLFLKNNQQFDLVYFPAQTENLFVLFQKTLPLAHNDSVFVFEKPHRSKEMEQIWKSVQQTQKVRVSIDAFYFGFVFFRKEQAKEDFVVRLN
ncbi:MAG TPA: hypothetical protein VFM65_08365 [Flavobacteriaceae bacterium]|nr:hypothetical protein [Flavobacteriaceae bacterium]